MIMKHGGFTYIKALGLEMAEFFEGAVVAAFDFEFIAQESFEDVGVSKIVQQGFGKCVLFGDIGRVGLGFFGQIVKDLGFEGGGTAEAPEAFGSTFYKGFFEDAYGGVVTEKIVAELVVFVGVFVYQDGAKSGQAVGDGVLRDLFFAL